MCSLRVDEFAFRLVSNPWFDALIIATIVINCIFLGLYDPTLESNEQETYLMVGEYIFSGIFVVELLVKWLALGIPTYFKDKWNWVDFIVVLESIVSVVLDMLKSTSSMNISALRGLRVLRPLRAVTYIQQVKLLFETVISASRVVIILLLCIGCVIIFFGNVGYTYWADVFENTCVDAATAEILDKGLVCGSGYSCPDGYVCGKADGFALNYGVTGYQDIWHAMLQAFQVVSLDGWQQVMWHTQDAAGEGAWIYFVMLLILGNVLLVSMFPAVISSKLEATIEKEEDRRRERMLEETGKGGKADAKRGKPASEFELLLIEYAKLEADEIATIERLAAVRRGDVVEQAGEEPPPPPWTPLPRNHRLNRLRRAVLEELGPFAAVVHSAIFLNAFVLCLDHAGASENEELVLSVFHKAFTGFFMVEMVIKLCLLGPYAYFTDAYNFFDFTITWIGLIEITVNVTGFFTGFRATRIFRIARVVRVAAVGKLGKGKFNPSPQIDLARMIGILMTSIPWIVNIYAVQVLLMYTFTVLGMQFFGGALPDVEPSNNSIRFNYNSFGKAGVTLLDLLTGNRWSEVMIDTVGATGQQTGIIFYVVWLVLSRWLVVAMVGTVLFYRVDVDTEDYLKIAAKTSMHSVFALERAFMQCNKSHVFLTWRKRCEEVTGNRSSQKGRIKLLEYSPPEAPPGPWQRILSSRKSLLLLEPNDRIRRFCQWLTSSEGESFTRKAIQSRDRGSLGLGGASVLTGVTGDVDPSALDGTAEWRPPLRRLRRGRERNGASKPFRPRYRFLHTAGRLHRVARSSFEGVMAGAVVVIMVVAGFDAEVASGRRNSAEEIPVMRVLEACAIIALFIEAVALILARGLVLHPGAYLWRPVYALTFGLVVLSAACLWGPLGVTRWDESNLISGVRALRALIVIRLVKFVYRPEAISGVLQAVTSSGRALCLAGGMALFFWVQWSIVGLQVWEGALGYCSDQNMARLNGEEDYYVYRAQGNDTIIEGQKECEENEFEWKNPRWNFDSFPQAMQSVLIIFSYNGWQEILFSTINARVSEEGLNAVPWYNTWAALYFLVLILTSAVLVLLVVGVVFSMYVFLNLSKGSDKRLSSLKQAFWLMYEAKLANVRPDTVTACPRDAHALRRWLFKVAVDPRWGVILVVLIGANVVVRFLVASQWLQYGDAPTWIHVQEAIFAVAFVLEWVSRAIAFGGVRALTSSPFQLADFATTLILALVLVEEIIFLAGSGSSSSQFWVAIEAISMVRLVRLGHVLPEIQEILHVFFKSSGVVFPLLAILAVLTYLWSVCGVILFGNDTNFAALFDERFVWEAVNRHQGFFSVSQGMQTMLGVATTPGSDGWLALMEHYEGVTPKEWRWGVVVFFSSYAILTRFLLVNFFMMTLLFNYKMYSNNKVGVATEQVNQFKLAWMRHAFTYTKEYQTICAGQLIDLLRDLPPPLGVGRKGSYYDCQILAKKVFCSMGVHAVAHVPAEHLTHVLSLSNGTRRGSIAFSGPGFLRLDFSKVLVAVHRILLFGVTLEEERHIKDTRARARSNLSVLKLGVHRFLDTPHNDARRREVSPRDPLQSVAFAESSLVRTQLPATFMARSSVSLVGEFLRWRDCLELQGYTDVAHKQGRCLANAIEHEIVTTTAFEQLTARLLESHVEDRRLFSRLAEMRQHAVTLRDLQGKLHTVRSDYFRTIWEGSSLVVRQIIQVDRKFGIAAVCASKDGTWLFCATCGGLLKVFKRERRSRARNRKSQHRDQGGLHPQYVLVQTLSLSGIKGERGEGVVTMGLSVACSPDGHTVVAGCSDSKVRVFAQDTLGLRRAVRAMKQVEGNRGKKPTVSYRAAFVGKGHKAAVKCVAWMESGYFYTGGAEGIVCMWRRSSAKQPVQSIDVCRSMFLRRSVECLTVWRTTYGLDLLASCVDIDDTKEVDPPVYVLVGDSEGYMSVLPARTDRKFFSIDVWKSSLKHKVDPGAGAVTAVEVAWGRVYTACGPLGLMKAWTPRWEDATKEKLLGFVQVGQFAVHSGAASSIVFTNKELMFSCSDDLSIVTWHPPRHPNSLETCAAPPRQQLTPHSSPSKPRPIPAHGTGREPKQRKVYEPEGGATRCPAITPAEVGAFDGDTNLPSAPVTHEKEPGFVVHEAGIAGMVAVPGAVVSVDLAGWLFVRGPKKLQECHFLQMLPQEEDIRRLHPSALRVLKARGRVRRSDEAITAVTGELGMSKIAIRGRTTPEDNKGPAVFLPQTTLDHLFATRALLRAKAKRRQKEEIRMEKQRAVELRTTGIFGQRLGQHQSPRDRQGAGASPTDFASPTRSSASETYRENRRRSLLQSVSANVEQVPQNTADADKVAEMDEAPAFLERADLDRLTEHPEVYLAELMSHFFPSRDLAGQPPAGQSESDSSSLFSWTVHDGQEENGCPGATLVEAISNLNPLKRFGGNLNLKLRPSQRENDAVGAINHVGREATGFRDDDTRVGVNRGGDLKAKARTAAGDAIVRDENEGAQEADGDRVCVGKPNSGLGALMPEPEDDPVADDATPAASEEKVSLAVTTVKPLKRTCRGEDRVSPPLVAEDSPPGLRVSESKTDRNASRMGRGSAECRSAPDASPPLTTGIEAFPAGATPGIEQEGGASRNGRVSGGSRSAIGVGANGGDAALPVPKEYDAASAGRDVLENGAKTNSSFPWEDTSAAQQRTRGTLIVYVPLSPAPGVWAAGIDVDPSRDVAWVLAETLRMYEREHPPLGCHRGLARKPRLVQRPSSLACGLFSRGQEWTLAPTLPSASPVYPLLRPGEELVVLVDGFNPGAAFGEETRVSVSAPHPAKDLAPKGVHMDKGGHERDVWVLAGLQEDDILATCEDPRNSGTDGEISGRGYGEDLGEMRSRSRSHDVTPTSKKYPENAVPTPRGCWPVAEGPARTRGGDEGFDSFSSRRDDGIRGTINTSGSIEDVPIDDDTLTDEEEGTVGIPR